LIAANFLTRATCKVPMQRQLFSFSVVLSILACPALFGQTRPAASAPQVSSSSAYDIRTFVLELRGLSSALKHNPSPAELSSIRDTLPEQWSVSTPDRSYSISTAPFCGKLTPSTLSGAQTWLDHLALEAQSYSDLRLGDSESAHSELTHILAQPEFAVVGPPSEWDLLRERISAWLTSLLFKILSGISRYPIGGRVLFWLFVFGGVLFVAIWVFRFLVSRDRMEALPPSELLAPSRTWQEWIRLSREAARRRDYREAVHAAYWAGIVRLQDTGVLPMDRAITPREYLHILSGPTAHDLLAQPALREALAGLTSRFERTWYANRGARPEDFSDSVRQLKELGCPLE
jgi:hypothetical protein